MTTIAVIPNTKYLIYSRPKLQHKMKITYYNRSGICYEHSRSEIGDPGRKAIFLFKKNNFLFEKCVDTHMHRVKVDKK